MSREKLPTIWRAADQATATPSDDEVRSDVDASGIRALFDGEALERI